MQQTTATRRFIRLNSRCNHGRALRLLLALCALGCTDPQFGGTEVTIAVVGVGKGAGVVTGPPSTKLRCLVTVFGDFECSRTFIDAGAGGIFTLQAEPDTISRFTGWGGACSGLVCNLSFRSQRDTTFNVSARFVLVVPPTVTISSPREGQTIPAGPSIAFAADATDGRGDQIYSGFSWTSNLDGTLCAESNLSSCRFLIRPLSTGQHVISVTLIDEDSATASASVRITVGDSLNTSPTVEILSPDSGQSFTTSDTIRFAGLARDQEDGSLPDSAVIWRSSRDGSLGSGFNLIRQLSAGSHRITLTATDSRGASGSASVDITVVPPAGACSSQPNAWYPLDGNGNDASGRGNNGVVNGATAIANRHGDAGQALAFDGVDDSIELGDLFNDLLLPFSIAVWVYRPAAAGESLRALFVTDDEPGRYAGIWFQTEALGRASITFADGGAANAPFRRTLTANDPILNDTWVHLVATVRGPNDMTLYINGTAVNGTYSGSGGPLLHTAAPARIGRISILPANQPWLGRMDDLRVYGCSLDATEVATLFGVR